MSRNLAFAVFLVAAAMSGGCAGVKYSSVDTESIKAQIRQADLALLRAEEQRDLDGAMDHIAPDAVFQPPVLSDNYSCATTAITPVQS